MDLVRTHGILTIAQAQRLINRELLYREYEAVTLSVGGIEVVWEPKYRNIQSVDLLQEIRKLGQRLKTKDLSDPPAVVLIWESRQDPDNPDSQLDVERELIQDPEIALCFQNS